MTPIQLCQRLGIQNPRTPQKQAALEIIVECMEAAARAAERTGDAFLDASANRPNDLRDMNGVPICAGCRQHPDSLVARTAAFRIRELGRRHREWSKLAPQRPAG